MTQNVADNTLGKIARQQNDLFRRIREGSLNPAIVSAQLQDAIQGNFTIKQIPIWMIVKQRWMGGSIQVDRAIETKTQYSAPDDNKLPINIGSFSCDWTLVRLKSSDLKAKGKDACYVCKQAQVLGLKLCEPEVCPFLCLQYDMRRGERFIMPFYAFSDKWSDPKICADFQYKPTGNNGRHLVSAAKPLECGVGIDQEWIFLLDKKFISNSD